MAPEILDRGTGGWELKTEDLQHFKDMTTVMHGSEDPQMKAYGWRSRLARIRIDWPVMEVGFASRLG